MLYRRYTIRDFDPETRSLDLDIFQHGAGGPGEYWVKTVRPGDLVEIVGPRGKIALVEAPWHLFAGDETYLPATFAMVAALPAGTPAWVFLEVADAQEEQPLEVSADVHLQWIHRGAAAPGDPASLVAAVVSAELPESSGHAYFGAELQVARALRSALEASGWDGTHISSKAYWGAYLLQGVLGAWSSERRHWRAEGAGTGPVRHLDCSMARALRSGSLCRYS
jgi:NADPH-dependent ferric siderophore reductase